MTNHSTNLPEFASLGEKQSSKEQLIQSTDESQYAQTLIEAVSNDL